MVQATEPGGSPQIYQLHHLYRDSSDTSGEIYWYQITAQNAQTHQWINPCSTNGQGFGKTLFLQGYWDAKGNFVDDSTHFTVSCNTGVLAKCIVDGYKPWVHRDYHQTCVRMLRADYCGDGVAHTKDGTPVEIVDKLGIQLPEPNPTGMTFEGAWGPSGALCVNHPRYKELTSLEKIKAECPEHFPEGANSLGNACQKSLFTTDTHALIYNSSFLR